MAKIIYKPRIQKILKKYAKKAQPKKAKRIKLRRPVRS